MADLARHHILRGDWEQGLPLLQRADAIASKDLDVPDFTIVPASIDAERLAYGINETTKMLADRPQMARGVEETDLLLQWTARQFGGEGTPNRMFWSRTIPRGSKAHHYSPSKESRGCIEFVALPERGPEHQWRDFEQLWLYAVFELNNAAGAEAFHEAYAKARAGAITRDEYVIRMFRTEYLAAVKTRRFYLQVFSEKVRQLNQHSDPEVWFFHDAWLGSWQRALNRYGKTSKYPWGYYGSWYDQIAPKEE